MKEHLDILQQYSGSYQIRVDVLKHIIKNPPEEGEDICSDEQAGTAVIQGFFNSPTAAAILDNHTNWAMLVGAAQM